VDVTPPCKFLHLEPVAQADGVVRYRVLYTDSASPQNWLLVNILEATAKDQPAIESYYQQHADVAACEGHWVTAPCPDNQILSGFPPPPTLAKTVY
jgi:hypothetical protein